MKELNSDDLRRVVISMPRSVRAMLENNRGLFVAGGFIRSVVSGEKPNDIDVFGDNADYLKLRAETLRLDRSDEKVRIYTSDNAITVLSRGRLAIQFIKRWLYDHPEEILNDFDFTVAQAVVWYNADDKKWHSKIGDRFYEDLAAKRLRYLAPNRDEDAGGSIMRVIKFLKRGYSISPESFGGTINRLLSKVEKDAMKDPEFRGKVIISLLREVDPLSVVDGVELVDDHQAIPVANQEGV